MVESALTEVSKVPTAAALQKEIDKTRAEIRTDGYPISIGEWISIYEKGELDIHPEFQRFFRWSLRQKSRLIESLLLGIPIPKFSSPSVRTAYGMLWTDCSGYRRFLSLWESSKTNKRRSSLRLRSKPRPTFRASRIGGGRTTTIPTSL